VQLEYVSFFVVERRNDRYPLHAFAPSSESGARTGCFSGFERRFLF
jgi:hypothetical protein